MLRLVNEHLPTHGTFEGATFRRVPVDSSVMRSQNAALLVQMIWAERQISRIDISRRTGLSPSTVSVIVNTLVDAGLVREVGTTTSARGRRPTLLAFCDDIFHIVGVEIGIRHVAVALTDLRGKVRAFRTERHEMRDGPAETLGKVRGLVNECVKEGKVSRRRLMGVGVAVPSPIDRSRPGVLSARLYPAWSDFDVQEDLEKNLRLSSLIDNDANLGALAEHWWGAGVGFDDVAYVKIGAGIGSGHILRGQLYRGASGTAGEIGHVCVDAHGPACVCGGRGCLAMLVGSDSLVAQARKLFGSKRATVADIVQEAHGGDRRAVRLLEEVAQHLGQVLVGTLINVMNPGVIVLGGEITAASNLLLEPLRKYVAERTRSIPFDTAHIVFSSLGPQAIAIGAATLYLDDAIRHPERFFTESAAAE